MTTIDLYAEDLMTEVEDYSEKLLSTIITGMNWYEAKAGYNNIPILLFDLKEKLVDKVGDIINEEGANSEAEVEKENERIWESIDTAILHNQPSYTELSKKTKAQLIEFIDDLYRNLDDLK